MSTRAGAKTVSTIAKAFTSVTSDDVSFAVDKQYLNRVEQKVSQSVTAALEDMMREVVRQVTLEKKLAQAYRRRVKQLSPHRTDIQREQDAAIRHLNDVLTRLGKLQ